MSKIILNLSQILTNIISPFFYNNYKSNIAKEGRCPVEYELYLDVLFLVNFMMDYLILLLSSRILKSHSTYVRILFGALVGAILTCIVIVSAIQSRVIVFILFHLVINSLMIVISLRVKTLATYLKALISLYIASVLLGGVFQLFSQYVTLGSLFFGLAILSYYLVKGIWIFIEQLGKYNQEYYPIELYIGEKVIKVIGLMDTGNSLIDPVSHKPVCILDKDIAKVEGLTYSQRLNEQDTLRESGQKESMFMEHIIPYNTISDEGFLVAITIDKLLIGGSKNQWVNKPIIAFSKGAISKNGTYQMILHPQLF